MPGPLIADQRWTEDTLIQLYCSGPVAPGNGTTTGAQLWSGSGVPAAALGNNGDFYFRTDTPGTGSQRIYQKSAGAWVALVV